MNEIDFEIYDIDGIYGYYDFIFFFFFLPELNVIYLSAFS
jgi:hypothetical protein